MTQGSMKITNHKAPFLLFCREVCGHQWDTSDFIHLNTAMIQAIPVNLEEKTTSLRQVDPTVREIRRDINCRPTEAEAVNWDNIKRVVWHM
jgi:hypothetical protein